MKQRTGIVVVLAVLLAALVWLVLRSPVVEPMSVAPMHAHASTEATSISEPSPIQPVTPTDEFSTSRQSVVQSELVGLRGEGVLVRVLDMEHKPIDAARIETFTDSVPAVVQSGPDGQARLPFESDATQTLRLAVDAPGFFHVRAFYMRERVVEVRLPFAARLVGQVLEPSSRIGVPGASIALMHSYCKGCPASPVIADASGRFEIEAVPVGRDSTFEIVAKNWPDQAFQVRFEEAAPTVEHDFVLDAGVEASGTIVDLTTGFPISGAVVEHEGREVARTDLEGRFTLRTVAARVSGRIDLRFGAEDHCWLRRDWIPEELVADSPIHVPLPRAAAVTGTVRDEEGTIVPGLRVVVHTLEPEFYRAIAKRELGTLSDLLGTWRIETESRGNSFLTGEAGWFRAPGLIPFTPVLKVSADAGERGRYEAKIGPLGEPGSTMQADLVLHREAHCTIAGRMLQNGAPRAGMVSWRGASRSGGKRTEKDGSFVLDDVEPGRVVVRTARGQLGAGRLLNREDVVHVTAGERIERDFDAVFPTKPVRGSVVHADGTPLSALTVTFLESGRTADAHRELTRTAEDGCFVVDLPVECSPYRAVVYLNDHATVREGVTAGDENVEIVVCPRPTVLCRALDAMTREPIGSLEVFALPAGGSRYELASARIGTTRADGWTPLQLEVGTYDLCVIAGAHDHVSVFRPSVSVAAVGDTRIEVEMERGLALELRLAQGVAAWNAGTRVVLLDEDVARAIESLAEPPASFADANPGRRGLDPGAGRVVDLALRDVVVVRGLAPGRYRLMDSRLELGFSPEVIEVRKVGNEPVAVSWRRK